MKFVDVTTIAGQLYCGDLIQLPRQPRRALVFLNCKSKSVPETVLNNTDFMILDGSFLGGKGFHSKTKFERDEENPAFNVYS